jgi:septal ring factor EnvC (AmiA/AmiB activator)
MKSEILKIKFVFAAMVLIGLFAAVFATNAQTSRRRTNRPVQPVVSSTPMQTLPVIISRADDIPSENQNVVSEPIAQPPEETVDDKIDASNKSIKELNTRMKSLESTRKNEYDEKQKRLLLNLDILSRAEQRAESLRKQLFEIIEKESTVQSKLDQTVYDSRSENLDRSATFAGSLRPEEIRDQRKKSLNAERKNLESLLTQIQNNRAVLEQSVEKADSLVERVRNKLEKEIDDALTADDNPKL